MSRCERRIERGQRDRGERRGYFERKGSIEMKMRERIRWRVRGDLWRSL